MNCKVKFSSSPFFYLPHYFVLILLCVISFKSNKKEKASQNNPEKCIFFQKVKILKFSFILT